MNFKEYFYLNEGRIQLPVDDVYAWVDRNIEEIISKLKETYKTKYQTYVNAELKLKNLYNDSIDEYEVYMNYKLPSSNEDVETALSFDKNTNMIELSATALINNLKSVEKIKKYIKYGIIHELTHANDPGRKFKKQDFTSFDTYINTDAEFPAFANQYIEIIKAYKNKEKVLDAIRKGKRIPISEIADWMESLSDDNKKKFINLLVKEIL
jgi:hypothetical protein